MDVIRLARGERAGIDTDCIKINEAVGGQFTLVGSALAMCEGDDVPVSVALVASNLYPNYEAAESAGLAWAAEQCVTTIHVETGDGPEPVRR